MEGFFILSWKVFNLVRKCCVSDNVHGNQRPILTSQIIKHPEFITASKEEKHTALVGFGSFISSVWIYNFFFFLKLFSHLLSKRKPISWELYKNIKRITSAVCHIYNRKVFYRNTNHHVRKSNKIHLLVESICTPNKCNHKISYMWKKIKHLPSDLLSTHC